MFIYGWWVVYKGETLPAGEKKAEGLRKCFFQYETGKKLFLPIELIFDNFFTWKIIPQMDASLVDVEVRLTLSGYMKLLEKSQLWTCVYFFMFSCAFVK